MTERDEPKEVTEVYDQNARHGIGQQEPLDVERQRREDAEARRHASDYDEAEYARVRGRLSGELSLSLRIFRMGHARELAQMGKNREQQLIQDVLTEVMASEPIPNDLGLAGNTLGDPAGEGVMDDPDNEKGEPPLPAHTDPPPKAKK